MNESICNPKGGVSQNAPHPAADVVALLNGGLPVHFDVQFHKILGATFSDPAFVQRPNALEPGGEIPDFSSNSLAGAALRSSRTAIRSRFRPLNTITPQAMRAAQSSPGSYPGECLGRAVTVGMPLVGWSHTYP